MRAIAVHPPKTLTTADLITQTDALYAMNGKGMPTTSVIAE
jgi:hypothetical protein